MNPQETQQVAARDEKWVPSAKRVKISSTNIRLETTVPQKEETFQVVIDIIKNSTCFKAFTISADVPEIFMQQFWYTIKKIGRCRLTDGLDDDTVLTFLIDLGYKGPLNRHTNMFVDHMHQPWRTLAAIINKCLSGKTASNDKLRKSRIDILWGMFNRENVDYPELIWEDFAYQIDHRKEKRSRRENMPYPRFTKIIINHFLKQHKSLTNLNHKHYHTIKVDGIVCRLKFVKIGEDYQEYGLPIPDVMLTDAIKRLESYQMFIKYSTNQIPPKKSRGKGSKGKKTTEESRETVDVSEESEPEPEPAKKQTSSKRRVKKKATLSADDNIISDDPDDALELAKSISQTKAKEAEAARKVHAIHARIVTESVPESAKKKSSGRKQEAADIMQALKESKKTSRRQPSTGGLNEGTGSKPRVPDESTIVSATSSEGTYAKLGIPDEDKDITEEKVILESGDEQDSEFSDDDNDDVEKDDKDGDADDEGDDHVSDTQDADDEDVETISNEDKIYKYKIRVRKDEDVEMKDAEVKESDKGEELVTDATKEEIQMVNSFLDILIHKKTPQTQSPSVQKIPISVIPETTNLPPIPEIVTETLVSTAVPSPQVTHIMSTVQQTPTPISTPPITTDAPTIITAVHESDALSTIELRVAKLEKDVSELKTVDHSSEDFVVLQSQVLTVVDSYLDTKVEDKSCQSSIVPCTHGNIDYENAMDKGVADTVKDHKRKHDDDEDDDDDDEDPPVGPNQGKKTKRRRTKESESPKKPSSTKDTTKGKTLTKGSKSGKSASAKEPVEEPIAEVIMDDAGDDVVRVDDQPQDTSKPKTRKTLNLYWFKQPPRPPTPDPEWSKRQVILDQPAQPWFNQMVSASKDPLTFNDLIATPIDFSKFVLNGIKIDNLTQDILLGSAFNLLKGTCSSSPLGHRTVAADYFFNNDLEYLKTSYPEVTYTTSIMKTKATRYEIKGIKDMVNKFSKQNVYSTKAILSVKSVSVKKLHTYGHLEEIVVKRSDQHIYKFKEGDFVDLHLNDIKDMLILVVQHKLFHLDGNVIFSDGTLKSVRDEIHHRVLDFRLDYNPEMPKRKWTAVD
ncbi:hypothetical protein Tco_1131882 [Tanacetum coccineum]|uniref:Uncharacterized protein n=1 Tax=Tanacetum coccineum TaxID=301880 RepID=A0ABQ5JBG0_9ASTR